MGCSFSCAAGGLSYLTLLVLSGVLGRAVTIGRRGLCLLILVVQLLLALTTSLSTLKMCITRLAHMLTLQVSPSAALVLYQTCRESGHILKVIWHQKYGHQIIGGQSMKGRFEVKISITISNPKCWRNSTRVKYCIIRYRRHPLCRKTNYRKFPA